MTIDEVVADLEVQAGVMEALTVGLLIALRRRDDGSHVVHDAFKYAKGLEEGLALTTDQSAASQFKRRKDLLKRIRAAVDG